MWLGAKKVAKQKLNVHTMMLASGISFQLSLLRLPADNYMLL
jgi:hypothetical protein